MKNFSIKILYFYLIVGIIAACVGFSVVFYWYGTIIKRHENHLAEIVFIHKNMIKTLYNEQVKDHNTPMDESFSITMKLIENSFEDTRGYGFSNEFIVAIRENGEFYIIYKIVNGKPSHLKESLGKLGHDNPFVLAFEGERGVIDFKDNQSVRTLTAYDHVDLNDKRLIILSRVPYSEIARPKFAAAVSIALLSLIGLIGGVIVYYYFSIKYIAGVRQANKELQSLTSELEDKVMAETEKRIQHEQLFFEQKKLADMGQMINAIAHQWRQPLNSLGLYVQYIVECVNDDSVTQEMLVEFKRDAVSMIQHMSKTIDDFRSFFNPRTDETEFEVINAVIETVSLVDAQLKSHYIEYVVSCKCAHREFQSCNDIVHPPCEHPSTLVAGYPSEFKQVLMNIIQNAKDALIGNSGQSRLLIDVIADDKNVTVQIEDNGGGIAPDIIGHIYDPYFTTKSEGKGTGIGLYMSKLIIEDHMQGTLHVYNKEGGALFEIVLKKV